MPIPYQDPSTVSRNLGSSTVAAEEREDIVISSPVTAAAKAEVLNTAPSTEYGLVVRPIPSGSQNIADGGGSITVDNATLAVVGGGTEATALRVTLANDSTGVVSVDDNGGSLTIDAASLPLPTGAATEATLAGVKTGTDKIPAQGQTTMAASLPVAIASNQTAIPVTDNSGSLTVDGSVAVSGTVTVDSELPAAAALADNAGNPTAPAVGAFGMLFDGSAWDRAPGNSSAGQYVTLRDSTGDSAMDDGNDAVRVNVVAGGAGDGAILDGVSSAIKATVLDYTNSNPLAVRLTDTNGDYAAASGSTQYTEDDASVANPVGTQLIARRRDSLVSETTTDGDVTALNATAKGELYVKHVDAVPVTDGGGSLTVDGSVTVSGTVTANAGSGTFTVGDGGASLTIDNPALSVTGGGTEATALRVTLANDSTGLVSVDDNGASLTVDNPALSVTGGGTEATALRVTLANDSTGVVSVDDNGGSLTIDGAVTATQGGTWTVQPGNTQNTTPWLAAIHDGTTLATVRNLAANDALNVAIVDGSGNQVTSFGGGTQFAEDAAHNTGDVGTLALAVANEANTARAADGDYIPLATDTEGNQRNVGNRDHDAVDAGEPVKIGMKAIAHGANPTAVAAADRTDLYANRAGIPFVIAGHPNIVTFEAAYTAAQTDTAIITVGAGAKIVVTQIQALLDEATTVGVGFRVGFGTANTPTTTGVVASHPGMIPGSIYNRGDGSGILGVGADNEDLRITSEVPTTGSLRILVSYYTIES